MEFPGRLRRLAGFDYALQRAYFITFHTRLRVPFFRDPAAAATANSVLLDFRTRGWYSLHAYCIMHDHIHAVLKPLGARRTLMQVVATLKSAIRFRCSAQGTKIVWQNGFHDRVIREHELTPKFIAYILENPVRARLVKNYRDYQFSGSLDSL
jgi:REP element-mobilizing transposase RayT